MNNYVRFFNADCQGRNISFYINGETGAQNIEFGKFSRYIKIDGNQATFGMSCQNCNIGDCGTLSLSFDSSAVYTVAAVCIGGEVCLYGIREMFGEPNRDSANLRVCNLSPDISEDDLYANRYKIIGDIDYLEISKYIKMIPDTYDFTIKDDKEIKFNIGKQMLKKGKYNTFYLIGKLNAKPEIRCIVSQDAMSYDGDAL